MFNDFKALNYYTTNHKIRKIKELLDRLTLEHLALEFNVKSIGSTINRTDQRVQDFVPFYQTSISGGEEPEPTSNLPDLIVVNIIPTTFSNYVNYAITVQNIGVDTSSSTTLNSIIPDLLTTDSSIPALSSNETYTTNVQYAFDPAGSSAQKTFISTVNPLHTASESNYNNNSKSVQSTVKAEYTPDGNAYVIFHLHNPEGKEINSITGSGTGVNTANINIEGTGGFTGASNLSEHGVRHVLSASGVKLVTATFNGITIQQNVDFVADTTTQLTIPFPRTDDLNMNYSNNLPATSFSLTSPFYEQAFSALPLPSYVFTPNYNVATGEASANWTLTNSSFDGEIAIKRLSGGAFGGVSHGVKQLILYVFDLLAPGLALIIPPTSAFNNWYAQSLQTGQYPTIALRRTGLTTQRSVILSRTIQSEPYYQFRVLSANDGGYDHLYMDLKLRADAGTYNVWYTDTNSGVLLNGGLKFSSVPYDLDGLAV